MRNNGTFHSPFILIPDVDGLGVEAAWVTGFEFLDGPTYASEQTLS